jgi:outer membrane receptor protein involved in Fe transport
MSRLSRRFSNILWVLLFSNISWTTDGFAQRATGVVAGRVISTANGLGVPNAQVSIASLGLSVTSSLDGGFVLEGVPAGQHDVAVVRDGFQSATISNVAVLVGEIARIDVPMNSPSERVIEMEAFKVAADIVQQSGLGLLLTRQRAVAVSDAIASDEMSRLSVGNAAEALGKTPGTSIVDGKYVVIRGLGDRYTNTQMNGTTVPSADPDKRAVQMDQFPSDLIDSITTLKSFTVDQPGAFSGGSVNLKTKSFPEQFFFNASVKTANNSNTTREPILFVPGGEKDWQGRDDGTRSLSSAVPNPMPSSLTTTTAQLAARQGNFGPAEQLDAISKGFNNATFFPTTKDGKPDFGFSVATGDSLNFENGQLVGYIASFNYDRSSRHHTGGITGRYAQGSVNPASASFVEVSRVFTTDLAAYNFAEIYRKNPTVPGGAPAFGVTRSAESVDWGAYLQIAWRPRFNHEFTSTFFHNQSAEDRVQRGIGEAVRSDSGGEFRENYDLLYTERGVTSMQLAGKSNFESLNDSTLEWRAAFSRSSQDQPDYRNFEFKWSFSLQEFDPSGITNSRYFRELEEESADFGVDFTRPISLSGDRALSLKTGVAYTQGERTNRERAFSIEGGNTRTRPAIEAYPNPVGITSRGPTSVVFGTVMREIPANLNYDGEQTFAAGYLMGDYQFNSRWRLIGGLRYEKTEIETTPLPTAGVTVKPGVINQSDALPALALIWSPWPKQNLRTSYGRTLARPTFRELADVVNYEAFTDEFIGGNPDLEMTVIDNLDLRWEWFPRGGEVIAASVFYKRLGQPIEQVFSAGRIFPNNVERGTVYGVELEARRKLEFLGNAFRNLSVGFNASVMESEVTISPQELALIRAVFPNASDKRELFGQSPFIFNFDATLAVPNWGSSFTVAYNVSGERLDLVTTGALPDVFEQPAPALDFIWSQRLSRRFKVKFAAKNLLDPDREKTLEHNGTTYFYQRSTLGRSFSLSLSYEFN